MLRRLRDPILVACVAGAILFCNLGGARLWDRDEPRNAGCAREMWRSGDLIVPRFNGELRTAKPALLYWLIIAASRVWGESEFAARFPSAALGVGTALLTWALGRRLFGPRAGRWAGLAAATNLLLSLLGRAATPDAALVFCLTLAMWSFVRQTWPAAELAKASDIVGPAALRPLTLAGAVEFYAALGLAVLAKGAVGVILPLAILGTFLFCTQAQRSWRTWAGAAASACRALRPLTGAAVVLAVAGPWYAAVAWRTEGTFLHEFFWKEHVLRATTTFENHAGPSLIYHPIVMLGGFFPWSVLAAPLLLDAWRQRRDEPAARLPLLLAACWVGMFLLAFSLARTKLPNYTAPAYPALALVVGNYLARWTRGAARDGAWPLRWAWGVLIATGLTAAGLSVWGSGRAPGLEWFALPFLLAAVAGAAGWFAAEHGWRRAAAGLLLAGGAAACLLATAILPARWNSARSYDAVFAAMRDRPAADLAAYGCLEPSWVYYGERRIPQLGTRSQASSPAEHLAASPDAVLLTTESLWRELAPMAPADARVLAAAPLFFRSERIMVVGREPPRLAAWRTEP